MSSILKYKPRGFRGQSYMTDLPNYNAIIEYAKDPNNELDIQYRGDYINIYYLGGSLLKLRGKGSIEFDAHYYYPPSKSRLRHPSFLLRAPVAFSYPVSLLQPFSSC